MERREMLTAIAGAAVGALSMALPAGADGAHDGQHLGQQEPASHLVTEVLAAINNATKEYRALSEGMRSKTPSSAFKSLAGYRRTVQVRGYVVTAVAAHGLMQLRFAVSGRDQALANLRDRLAGEGYLVESSGNSLTFVVEVATKQGQIPLLLAHVYSNQDW